MNPSIEEDDDIFFTPEDFELLREADYPHEHEEAAQSTETNKPHRFQLRLPTSLHEQAVLAAGREGVSLNAYIGSMLAAVVGWRPTDRERQGCAAPPEEVNPYEHLNRLFR